MSGLRGIMLLIGVITGLASNIVEAQNETTAATTMDMTTAHNATANMTASMTTDITTTLATGNVTGNSTVLMTTLLNTTSNGTTFTVPFNATTLPPTTATPCATTNWVVRDTNGAICMLMSFDGSIQYNETSEVTIPSSAVSLGSTCDVGEGKATFAIAFPDPADNETIWILGMDFTKADNEYDLKQIAVVLIMANETDQGADEVVGVTIPLGKYYSCDEFIANIENSKFVVGLTNPIFQPFVQDTKDTCGLGDKFSCGGEPSSKNNTGLIVGCVIGGIAGLALAAGLTYYIVNKRKTSKYQQM